MRDLIDDKTVYQTRVVLSAQDQEALELGRRIMACPDPGFTLEHDPDDPAWWVACAPDEIDGYVGWSYGYGATPLEALKDLGKEAE